MLHQPRQVKLRTIFEVAKRKQNLYIIGPVWLFASIVCGVVLIPMIIGFNSDVPKVDHDHIREVGNSTTAVITNIEVQSNITVNGDHPSKIFYRYTVDGTPKESRFKTLAPHEVSRLAVGDSIQIKYLNEESTIDSMEPFEFPVWPFVLGIGIFFVGGLGATLYVLYYTRNEVNLYKYGKVRDAEILSMTHTKIFFVRTRGDFANIGYRYTGADGRKYVGEKQTRDVALTNTLKQGDTIKIFVSPDDESKSTLIPKLEAVRNNWKID